MKRLLSLLKDGRSRPLEMMASDLGTSVEDVRRKIEFLERSGIIRRVPQVCGGCAAGPGCGGASAGCGGCGGASREAACSACMPEGGFRNMGVIWEVVG